jgi:hypothetical protein
VIFEPEKKTVNLDISSTNTYDTLVPSLYQCVETRSIEVFLLSQPFPHLSWNLFAVSETFAAQL